MKTSLMAPQSNDSNLVKTRQATPSLKVIAFMLGNLNLALRIESVYKVVDRTPIYSSGINEVGIAHLGDREVTVFDLEWRFFKSRPISALKGGGYIVILQNKIGELYGIPVADTPILMEVPLSTLRQLPESYRRADTLQVASHVIVVPQDGIPLTLFLLDVDLLLPLCQKLSTFAMPQDES